jgi:hypothetical protein
VEQTPIKNLVYTIVEGVNEIDIHHIGNDVYTLTHKQLGETVMHVTDGSYLKLKEQAQKLAKAELINQESSQAQVC